MRTASVRVFLMLAAVVVLAACGSSGTTNSAVSPTDVDGGVAKVSLAIKLAAAPSVAKSDALPASDAGGGTLAVSEARAVISKVELEVPDGTTCADVTLDSMDAVCDDSPEDLEESPGDSGTLTSVKSEGETEVSSGSDEIEFKGPFILDMIAGTVTPALTDLVIPSGIYKKIKIAIAHLEEGSSAVPPEDMLAGRSLVIAGTHDNGSEVRQFLIALTLDQEVQFEDPAGFPVVESATVNNMVLSFDVNAWFAGVDIGACLDSGSVTADGAGVFVITEATSGDACQFADVIKLNIKAAGTAEVEHLEDGSSSDGSGS